MTITIVRYSQEDALPLSISDVRYEVLRAWLSSIVTPASVGDPTNSSFDFVILGPNGRDCDPLVNERIDENEQETCLRDCVRIMGHDPNQVVVENDTVDFNIHYPNVSADAITSSQFLPLYSIADNVFGLWWTWDPVTYSTRGLLWHRNDEGQRQCHFILEGLSRLQPVHAHELLPALLTLQIETTEMRFWVDSQAAEIMDCQIQTGYHQYIDVPFHGEGGYNGHELPKLDLATMTRKICGFAVNISTSVLCLRRIVQLADFILEQATAVEELQQRKITDQRTLQQSVDATRAILARTRSAKRRAEGLMAEAASWQQKSNIVVQTLMSLTTQRDQNISISIAEDSRTLAHKATRDSQSMKAIAAVTMCFLPGTFIASIFAMPIFDWNGHTEGPIIRHFWIYWTVTLPLTVVVIVIWLLSTNRQLLRSITRRKGVRNKSPV